MNIIKLQQKANQIRNELIRVAIKNKAGHIASSLSCVDILVILYYEIMVTFKHKYFVGGLHNVQLNSWENRDRLILSKGHGCYGLYAILADIGIINKEDFEDMGYSESRLKGCVEYNSNIGLEASTGSLGHGLPIAVGIAYGLKLQNKQQKVYCIIGDGELQEGSNWEALEFASLHNLNNLIVIVDNNNLQALDRIEYTKYDILRRTKAFGCWAVECNGHNYKSLINTITELDGIILEPRVIIATTIKGKGLKCMEDIAEFHYRIPTDEELNKVNHE